MATESDSFTGGPAAGSFAARVSAALGRGGVKATGASNPRNRERVRVRAVSPSNAHIHVDFDTEALAAERADECEKILRAAGYIVDHEPGTPRMTVARGAGIPDGWKKRKDPMGRTNYEHRWYPGWVIEVRGTDFTPRKLRYADLPGSFPTLLDAIDWIVEANAK